MAPCELECVPEVEEETVSFGGSACVSLVEVEEPITTAECDSELLEVDFESRHGVNIETVHVAVFAVPFVFPFDAARPSVGLSGRAFYSPTQHGADKGTKDDFTPCRNVVFQEDGYVDERLPFLDIVID